MVFYHRYLDCGREHADYYVNTPHVSASRANNMRLINFRWGPDVDPSKAVIEFANHSSILPYQAYRTTTTRGSLGVYAKTTPDMIVPLSHTVSVPPSAQNFRVRFDMTGPYVTNSVVIHANDTYHVENDRIYSLYEL